MLSEQPPLVKKPVQWALRADELQRYQVELQVQTVKLLSGWFSEVRELGRAFSPLVAGLARLGFSDEDIERTLFCLKQAVASRLSSSEGIERILGLVEELRGEVARLRGASASR